MDGARRRLHRLSPALGAGNVDECFQVLDDQGVQALALRFAPMFKLRWISGVAQTRKLPENGLFGSLPRFLHQAR